MNDEVDLNTLPPWLEREEAVKAEGPVEAKEGEEQKEEGGVKPLVNEAEFKAPTISVE